MHQQFFRQRSDLGHRQSLRFSLPNHRRPRQCRAHLMGSKWPLSGSSSSCACRKQHATAFRVRGLKSQSIATRSAPTPTLARTRSAPFASRVRFKWLRLLHRPQPHPHPPALPPPLSPPTVASPVTIAPLGSPHMLLADTATMERLRSAHTCGAPSAVRFKSIVDAQLADPTHNKYWAFKFGTRP